MAESSNHNPSTFIAVAIIVVGLAAVGAFSYFRYQDASLKSKQAEEQKQQEKQLQQQKTIEQAGRSYHKLQSQQQLIACLDDVDARQNQLAEDNKGRVFSVEQIKTVSDTFQQQRDECRKRYPVDN
jgi:uncharacterized protein HemX